MVRPRVTYFQTPTGRKIHMVSDKPRPTHLLVSMCGVPAWPSRDSLETWTEDQPIPLYAICNSCARACRARIK